MRYLSYGVAALMLATAGCGKKGGAGGTAQSGGGTEPAAATPGPIAFTLTALELAKAYDADAEAFAAKFAGKWVEMTGTVQSPRVSGSGPADVLLEGDPKAKQFFAKAVSVTPSRAERDKYQGLKALAKGQTVTVRGQVEKGGIVLTDCSFVSAGPSTALPVTAEALQAALQTDEGKAKYADKDVVLRAEVRKAEWNGTVATLTVGDPGVAGGPGLEASLNPQAPDFGAEMGKTKVGSVVVLLGEAQTANGGRIWDVRVLTAPPEGVTLPAAKK